MAFARKWLESDINIPVAGPKVTRMRSMGQLFDRRVRSA